MNNKNIIISLIIIILLLLGGGFLYINSLKNNISDLQFANRKLEISKDSLVQVNDTQFRKLVADTLTKKQLRKKIDSLGFELDNVEPKIVYQIKYVPKEIEKPTDEVVVEEDTVKIDSYYPQKENYFMRYQNTISLKDGVGLEKWTPKPISLSGVISQRDDGIWTADFQTPDWLDIESVDIEAVPLDIPKKDRFGWLIGASYGKDFQNNTEYLRLSTGIRVDKFYIDVGASTNSTIDGGIKYEF